MKSLTILVLILCTGIQRMSCITLFLRWTKEATEGSKGSSKVVQNQYLDSTSSTAAVGTSVHPIEAGFGNIDAIGFTNENDNRGVMKSIVVQRLSADGTTRVWEEDSVPISPVRGIAFWKTQPGKNTAPLLSSVKPDLFVVTTLASLPEGFTNPFFLDAYGVGLPPEITADYKWMMFMNGGRYVQPSPEPGKIGVLPLAFPTLGDATGIKTLKADIIKKIIGFGFKSLEQYYLEDETIPKMITGVVGRQSFENPKAVNEAIAELPNTGQVIYRVPEDVLEAVIAATKREVDFAMNNYITIPGALTVHGR